MLTVAYLANQFPVAVEPYVAKEIAELRSRGIRVIAGSVSKPSEQHHGAVTPDLVVRVAGLPVLFRACLLCARRWRMIASLIRRILIHGSERPMVRAKALVHTFWGGCFAAQLEGKSVDHIHVHHGFSASWIALVASRLLGIEFSMTLHGSDLLLHRTYLDVKLKECSFCVTISEYNRRFILERYPEVGVEKIVVSRLGVEIPAQLMVANASGEGTSAPFRILAVGRLHAVKDHAFLVRACGGLRARDLHFECDIAGEGPERRRLESLIRSYKLEGQVRLLGHADREQLDSLYARADLIVLTSRSEGIPLVLMEAMARGKLVLAPDITGIPELVIAGHTGFLYQAGSMNDFLEQLSALCSQNCPPSGYEGTAISLPALSPQRVEWIRHAARLQVEHNFNREKNLNRFCDLFLQRIQPGIEETSYESAVLQQI